MSWQSDKEREKKVRSRAYQFTTQSPDVTVVVSETPGRRTVGLAIMDSKARVQVAAALDYDQWQELLELRYDIECEAEPEPPPTPAPVPESIPGVPPAERAIELPAAGQNTDSTTATDDPGSLGAALRDEL